MLERIHKLLTFGSQVRLNLIDGTVPDHLLKYNHQTVMIINFLSAPFAFRVQAEDG